MDRFLEAEQTVLSGVAEGRDTGELIRSLVELIERCLPGLRCSVHLADEPSGGAASSDPPMVAAQVCLGGRRVAAIALYSHEGREPTAEEEAVLGRAATLLSVVLRRDADLRHTDAMDSRYRMLIREMPVIAYETALDGQMRMFVSPQIENVLGFTSEELAVDEVAQAWRRMLHPEDRDAVAADWERAREEGRTWDGE
jgi:PAS domain-containing protein